MREYILSPNKRFFKANLHSHSNYSDGALSPAELKELYKSNGYQVLSITDHDALFDHSYLNDDDFLTLPGYEKEIKAPSKEGQGWNSVITCHLCLYPRDRKNLAPTCFDPDFYHPKFRWTSEPELRAKVKWTGEPYKAEYSVESINHIIDSANKSGFIVTLNHLRWSQEPYEQYSRYKGLFAMEIYNRGSELIGLDEYNSALYDQMLRLGNRICCVAADDNHNFAPKSSPYFDSFGGFVMINAESLCHEQVFSALENGKFYSSTGPLIEEMYIEEGRVFIKCSEAKKIRLLSSNRYSKLILAEDKPLTEASFDISQVSEYFRIEITDFSGEKAYTNAHFI